MTVPLFPLLPHYLVPYFSLLRISLCSYSYCMTRGASALFLVGKLVESHFEAKKTEGKSRSRRIRVSTQYGPFNETARRH